MTNESEILEVEKRKTKSEKQTTRKLKTDKGTIIHQKKVNKDTGKLEKDVVLDEKGKKIQETIEVTNDNALIIMSKLLSNIDYRENLQTRFLEKIHIQLVEMNYYMAHIEELYKKLIPEDNRESKSILEHFDKLGIKLNEKGN